MTEPRRGLSGRAEAGRLLGDRLARQRLDRPLVLGLPRGGVPVGFEVAVRLRAPLDVLVVRKIGAPGNEEYGLGAVAEDGTYALDVPRAREAGYSVEELRPIIERERSEAERRVRLYRDQRPIEPPGGRTVVVVDDGAATGGTLLGAIRVLRAQGAQRVIAALGVAPPETCRHIRLAADRLEVLLEPPEFFAVGQFYSDFAPVTDQEVVDLLRRARDAYLDGGSGRANAP